MIVYAVIQHDNDGKDRPYMNMLFETREKAEKARQDLIKDAKDHKWASPIVNFFSKLWGNYKYYDTELYIGEVEKIESGGFLYKIIGWNKDTDSPKLEIISYDLGDTTIYVSDSDKGNYRSSYSNRRI